MKPLPIYLLAAAMVGSTMSLQAQLSDEQRKARMEERRSKGGKSKGRGEDKAPKVGTQAPDLGVRKKLNGEEINLSDPNRISVLVFGSHT